MKPQDEIKKLYEKAAVNTNPKMDNEVLSRVLAAQRKLNIGRIIIRNPVTKFAAAAVITIAIILGLKGFNGNSAWAEVEKEFTAANDIHIVGKRSVNATGETSKYQLWVKNRKLIRSEDEDSTHIVNGTRQLWLLRHEKTARLVESESDELFEWPLLQVLRGETTKYPTEIKTIGNITKEGVTLINNVWVDPNKNLPIRGLSELIERETKTVLIKFDYTCDYESIPSEIFELIIPNGYTDISNIETRVLSGKVMDEKGRPVAGAEIIASNDQIRGQTNQEGQFAIKLSPDRFINGFPMIIRAIKSDDPNHIAWTLLRNPRQELRPLFIPDDGKTKLEQGGDVDIYLFNETTLREFIPESSGTMIFKSDDDKYPSEIKDIVLKMQPASIISGQITNRQGQPVTNAIVRLEQMEVSVGENEIWIHSIGQTDKEKEIASSLSNENVKKVRYGSFAITDNEGYYKLGNIPNIWYRARLEVKADDYVQVAKEIFQNEGNDFVLLEADVTIRGTVIDNQGNPVIGREVEIDIDSDEIGDLNIEEFYTDSEGKFELKGIPEVNGLELQIRTDEKPRNWEENELTRDHEFVYYRMIEEMIKFEPGKKEYSVNIVPHRPDIKLEIEVKDTNGKSLEGVPVGIISPGFSERIWYTTKLCGVTDENGLCIINETPRNEPLKLWICIPPRPELWEDDDESEVNQQVRNAINELGRKYYSIEETIDLQKDKKNYKISITLN